MASWTPCYSQAASIKVGSKTFPVVVHVSWQYEDQSVEGDFDFGDEDANAEYLARFESGELSAVCIRVKAQYLGEEGTDYLGMVHVKSSYIDADVKQAVEDHGMVDIATKELQANLITRLAEYKALASEAGL